MLENHSFRESFIIIHKLFVPIAGILIAGFWKVGVFKWSPDDKEAQKKKIPKANRKHLNTHIP